MTTQALSKRGLWNGRYFLGELRRSWANLLLYALVFFFGLPVPLLVYMNQPHIWRGTLQWQDVLHPSVFLVLVMGVAVWAGCASTRFLYRRTSAYFYHSLPIQREGILFVKGAVALVDFVLAFAVNFVAYLFLMRQSSAQIEPGEMFVCLLFLLFSFCAIYTFTVCLGLLCGTQSFHFVMLVLGGGLLPAFSAAIMKIGEASISSMQISWLVSAHTLRWLSPFIYLPVALNEMEQYPSVSSLIISAAFAIVCMALSLYLIHIRPAESAEKPVVFRPVEVIVKYAAMGPITLFTGLFFESLTNGSTFLTIFGLICGGVLSFMLMNLLLTRNARQMFRGLIGLGCFGLGFVACVTGLNVMFNALENHVYAPDQVSVVEIQQGYMGDAYALTSPEVAEATCQYLESYLDQNQKPITFIHLGRTSASDRIITPNRMLYITLHTKTGQRQWKIYFDQYPQIDAAADIFCRAIAADSEFQTQYLTDYADALRSANAYNHSSKAEPVAAIIDDIIAEIRQNISFDYFQQPQITELQDIIHVNHNFPVYLSQQKLFEMLSAYLRDDTPVVNDPYAEQASAYTLYQSGGANATVSVTISAREQMEEIYRTRAYMSPYFSYYMPFFLTRLDTCYFFQDEYGNHGAFLKNKVPDFVVELFAKKS